MKQKVLFSIKFVLLVSVLFMYGKAYAQCIPEGLIFWNKLGSETEVVNSEFGTSGIIAPPVNFAPVEFGNGVACPTGSSLVSYYRPFDPAFPQNGTIEFWWIPQYEEDYRMTSSHYNERQPFVIYGGNPICSGWKSFFARMWFGGHSGAVGRTGVCFLLRETNCAIISYSSKYFDLNFAAKQKMHVAITWDSADPDFFKLYIDGVEQTATSSGSLNPSELIADINSNLVGKDYYLMLNRFAGRPDGAADKVDPEQLVDNIKIWNYAKTDFSDIYKEGFYEDIPWLEDFTGLPDGTKSDDGATSWTSSCNTGVFEVKNERFVCSTMGSEGEWKSGIIDISQVPDVDLTMDIRSFGPLHGKCHKHCHKKNHKKHGKCKKGNEKCNKKDYLKISYVIDCGEEILLTDKCKGINKKRVKKIHQSDIEGEQLQIIIRAKTTGKNKYYVIDNIHVADNVCLKSGNVDEITEDIGGYDQNINIYPNPASDIISFNSNDLIKEVNIFDISGKKLVNRKINSHTGELEVNNLKRGLYYISFITSKGSVTHKLILH